MSVQTMQQQHDDVPQRNIKPPETFFRCRSSCCKTTTPWWEHKCKGSASVRVSLRPRLSIPFFYEVEAPQRARNISFVSDSSLSKKQQQQSMYRTWASTVVGDRFRLHRREWKHAITWNRNRHQEIMIAIFPSCKVHVLPNFLTICGLFYFVLCNLMVGH